MRRTKRTQWILPAALAAALLWPAAADGQSARRTRASRAEDAKRQQEFEASRLLKTARNVLGMGENERGVRMLETILEQYPTSDVRFKAHLELGRHYLASGGDKAKAIAHLRQLKQLKSEETALTGENREMYLEALYLTGVAQFEVRNYAGACAVLRKITREYPNTVWANQAYYHIGMCHFAQKHWKEAIRNLSLVGTFVDPSSPTVDCVEAGRRFYVKIEDDDLPVLGRLGKSVSVKVATAKGDAEVVRCIPLAEGQAVRIGSLATTVGPAKKGDGVLQVVGGDELTVQYVDVNTQEGKKDVARAKKVRVVSTATVNFTVSTYASEVGAAFFGQPLYVLLRDVDLDTSKSAEQVKLRVLSRYKAEDTGDEPDASVEPGDEEEKYRVRDEVRVTLAELGAAPVHSGRFGGLLRLTPHREDTPPDKTDQLLSCAVGDEIVAAFVDDRHVLGKGPRQVEAKVVVSGEIDNAPRATQDHVPDPIIRSRKKLVEATAFLELARIFNSMGLKEGAAVKADEGIQRVDPIIRMKTPIPARLRQEAFKLKWDLYIAQEDYTNAIATCRLFHRLYPESPYVDQALMSVARIKLAEKDYRMAVRIFRQVLAMPKSQARAEAQFMIAQATEIQSEGKSNKSAIAQYRLCAERFADSEFAGPSLAKLVQHHIDSQDYARATDLLGQVFRDHPDGEFLDQMLLKWVEVALKMGDYRVAKTKCEQLIFSYPGSPHARKAKDDYLPSINRMIESTTKKPAPKGNG